MPYTSSGFNLSNFISQINSTGILRSNFFSVLFSPPNIMTGNDTRPIILFCDGVNLPGVSFDTVSGYQRYGYGQAEKIPFMPIFQDAAFSFLVDNQGYVKSFFDLWVNSIVNFNMSQGLTGNINNINAYEISYKSDIISDIQVYFYDENINQIIQITLRSAFPLTLSNLNLNWNEQNQILRLGVFFTFRDWYSDQIQPTVSPGGFNSGLSAYEALQNGSTIVDVMSSLPQKITNSMIGNIILT